MSTISIQKQTFTFIVAGVLALALTQIGSVIYLLKKINPEIKESKIVAVTSANVNSYIDEYFEAIHRKQIEALYSNYELADDSVTGDKRIYGAPNARFTLTEFSDIECPFCKKFHLTPKKVVDASNGLINWEWNHFPLPMHNPSAFMEAHAAECARSLKGNKGFWVYTDQLFQRTKGNGNGAGDLSEIADYVGIDKTEFDACMKDGRHRNTIKAQMEKATSLNINSTPTTFLVDNSTGDVIPIDGQVTPESIAEAIENHVSKK